MDHLSRVGVDKDEEVYLIRMVLFFLFPIIFPFLSFSDTVTCAPFWAALTAATSPPGPAPENDYSFV
jgi:hypothetical protein